MTKYTDERTHVKKKHTKSFEAVSRRISVLSYEIHQRQEELRELAVLMQQFEQAAQVELRALKSDGISVAPLL